MPRPQFTLRALLVLLLAVACFFGGIRFERERRRREDEAAAKAAASSPARVLLRAIAESRLEDDGSAPAPPGEDK